MALNKVTYVDGETVIYAQNLNNIQDAIIELQSDAADLEEGLNVLEPAAVSSDVGKALIVKSVSGGKATAYEFGEAGGGGGGGGAVNSVNGKTGTVVLDADDVGAAADDVIIISETQPTSATNKLWINSSESQSVSVPTVAEMNAAVATKITAPANASIGQFLVFNGSAWDAQTVPSANGVSF